MDTMQEPRVAEVGGDNEDNAIELGIASDSGFRAQVVEGRPLYIETETRLEQLQKRTHVATAFLNEARTAYIESEITDITYDRI